LRVQQKNILKFYVFDEQLKLNRNKNVLFLIPRFHQQQSTTFSCILMLVTWYFLKRTVTVMNKSHIAETNMYFLCIGWMKYCGQNNIFKFLVVPKKDTSPWNWKLRTAQVSSCFHFYSYFQTVFINVFSVFGVFAQFRIELFFCSVLFVSGLAHILWLTVASGCNKERCIPEILSLLCPRHTLLEFQDYIFDWA
jgi:hypothetical protein